MNTETSLKKKAWNCYICGQQKMGKNEVGMVLLGVFCPPVTRHLNWHTINSSTVPFHHILNSSSVLFIVCFIHTGWVLWCALSWNPPAFPRFLFLSQEDTNTHRESYALHRETHSRQGSTVLYLCCHLMQISHAISQHQEALLLLCLQLRLSIFLILPCGASNILTGPGLFSTAAGLTWPGILFSSGGSVWGVCDMVI